MSFEDALALLIPEHMQQGLRLYLEDGLEPGGFLYAVLTNDLAGAVGRADSTNVRRLPEYVQFLYNYAPAGSWGSERKVAAWMDARQKEMYRHA